MREAQRMLAGLLEREDVRRLTDRLLAVDAATYRHCLRVARFAIVLARVDGMDDARVRQLAVAAMLHDLGKAEMPRGLVEKPGPLTDEERAHMRTHPSAAARHLQELPEFPDAHRIAPLHHELQGDHPYPRSGRSTRREEGERRAEGRGEAPDRRAAEREPDRRSALPAWIERAGEILALADRYDALISRRSYKDPWPDDEVRAALRAEMGEIASLLDGLEPPERPPR